MITEYNVMDREDPRICGSESAARAGRGGEVTTSDFRALLVAEVAGAEVELELVARLDEDRIPADVAQRELQDAVRLQPKGARRQRGPEIVERRAARAGDVLADARRRLVAAARRVHRLEPLVEMIVAVHHDVHAVVVQKSPDRKHDRVAAGAWPRGEQRMVPV